MILISDLSHLSGTLMSHPAHITAVDVVPLLLHLKGMSLLPNVYMMIKPAQADKHLIMKERLKLTRAGACDPNTNNSLTGEG